MTRLPATALSLLGTCFFLSACGDPAPPPKHTGHLPPPHPVVDSTIDNPPPERVDPPHREVEAPIVHIPPPAPATAGAEYGKAVPGKPGFVTSPYAPGSGYVDVRGFPPGTEVKDPYSGKVFLVPAQ